MLRNEIYYSLKPLIPTPLRRTVRRYVARRVRRRTEGVWPIYPGSESAPEGWAGWPHGRRFAVVLTHDVERVEGLKNSRRLMQLEDELGFKSSFNFVPEGRYELPADLRQELVEKGFEVGVHDLKHDGRLFQSHKAFTRKAAQISTYLHEWKAAGFRSAFAGYDAAQALSIAPRVPAKSQSHQSLRTRMGRSRIPFRFHAAQSELAP